MAGVILKGCGENGALEDQDMTQFPDCSRLQNVVCPLLNSMIDCEPQRSKRDATELAAVSCGLDTNKGGVHFDMECPKVDHSFVSSVFRAKQGPTMVAKVSKTTALVKASGANFPHVLDLSEKMAFEGEAVG